MTDENKECMLCKNPATCSIRVSTMLAGEDFPFCEFHGEQLLEAQEEQNRRRLESCIER